MAWLPLPLELGVQHQVRTSATATRFEPSPAEFLFLLTCITTRPGLQKMKSLGATCRTNCFQINDLDLVSQVSAAIFAGRSSRGRGQVPPVRSARRARPLP